MEHEIFNNTVVFTDVVDTNEDTIIVRGYANRYTDSNGNIVIDDHNTTFKGTKYVNLDVYLKHPVVYYAHDLNRPVGKVNILEFRDDGLYVEATIFKDIDPQVFSMVKNKVVSSFSFGVMIKEAEWSDILNATIITECELFDISLVALPSNTESTIETVDMCSLGQCSTVRKRITDTTTKSTVDQSIITTMTKKILNIKD